MTEQTLFEQLNSKNVNDHTEQKNGLTYLAWSYAHQELKKIDPNYTVKCTNFRIQILTQKIILYLTWQHQRAILYRYL
ncbi:DUF1071 domain-containing protein [Staphylococcus aureus]|nr:DUF1071 domain-containing protein [Staphylococcus aureus]